MFIQPNQIFSTTGNYNSIPFYFQLCIIIAYNQSTCFMSLPQQKNKRIFDLYKNQMRVIFSLQQSVLSIQLWVYQENKIYDRIFTEQTYSNQSILKRYFPSYRNLYKFITQLNDQYIAADKHGKIQLTIFGDELQEKNIEINLNKQNQIEMLLKIQSLENAYLQLAKHFIREKKNHEEQMSILRKDFQKMMINHDIAINNAEMKISNQQQNLIHRHKKHNKISINERKIMNQSSKDYEVRWAIIGSQVSKQNPTFLKIKVNKVSWLALGFCHQNLIKTRKYTRLNGCEENGAYVMDSYGWIYAHKDQKNNYKQSGFIIDEKDVITIIYDPKESVITFINHTSWKRFDLNLEINGNDIYPCIACNMQTDIEIINYQK